MRQTGWGVEQNVRGRNSGLGLVENRVHLALQRPRAVVASVPWMGVLGGVLEVVLLEGTAFGSCT